MKQFRPHPIYFLLLLAMLVLACLLAWGLRTNVTVGDLLFLGIVLGALLYFAHALTTALCLTDTAIFVRQPLLQFGSRFSRKGQSPSATADPAYQPMGRSIAFRQLIRIDRSGRLLPALTLLYHPLHNNGFIAVDEIAQVTLPMLIEQEALQERLEAVIPK